MEQRYDYSVSVEWTGNNGHGTTGYADYERNHAISSPGKPDILASSDTPFRGDASRHNPETLLLSSLSTCHMLWYLHLCADAGIIVTKYTDTAPCTMTILAAGNGHFKDVTLHTIVTITDKSRIEEANALHEQANKKCFIANSVKFTVHHKPTCLAE